MRPDIPVVQIERFSQSRESEVWSLISQVWAEFDIHDDPRAENDLGDLAHAYQGGASGFWIAISDNRVVGTACLKDLGDGLIAVKRFYVLKEFRGTTIGTAQFLLDHLVQHARQSGAKSLCLGTIELTVAAQRFYEKNGFQKVPRSELPTEQFAAEIDTLFYRLPLV
ncbi:GNAT family N-acetyltransferase [Paraburkholderia sp.]|jgi:GNAT superfamily N-acetyltransferase|uniref:GNAT family N-acetyltransferase n=1 Tax=Paraburkholderia sp. TaxID=1926495 RepID=UPI002639DC55|nr:GNAT family N-acetyltransferase [Paraburkholderia sp.]